MGFRDPSRSAAGSPSHSEGSPGSPNDRDEELRSKYDLIDSTMPVDAKIVCHPPMRNSLQKSFHDSQLVTLGLGIL